MITAIILAGGKGKRFGKDIPKQYTDILGKPALYWPLQAFQESKVDSIVLVCEEKDKDYCKNEIIARYGITKCTSLVTGGAERYNSVYNGLCAARCTGEDYVLIHDGARVCIDTDTINKAVDDVKAKKACVVGVHSVDTIQESDDEGVIIYTPPRKNTWIAQTPQCFYAPLAVSSYNKAIDSKDTSVTDDAMVAVKYGNAKVYMTEGRKDNIKLTTVDDLQMVQKTLEGRMNDREQL